MHNAASTPYSLKAMTVVVVVFLPLVLVYQAWTYYVFRKRVSASDFPEEAIFRVDDWLAFDPVENVLFVRFANSVIEPLLNRNYVHSIQITMAEAFDVADRGRFYDRTGAIRDVLQNHMLQVLATVLAEPPTGSDTNGPAGPTAPATDSTGPGPPAPQPTRTPPAPPRTAGRTSAPAPRSGSGTPAARWRSAPGTRLPRTR